MNKEEMKEALHKGQRTITFIKSDGSTRVLVGTLKNQLLNNLEKNESKQIPQNISPEPDHLIRVYDLENEGWRSFVVDRVTDFS